MADKALADLNTAIKLDPQFAMAFTNRGWLSVETGEFDKALADFNAAAKISPKNALIANNLAWFRATCPSEKYRDGKQAVALATLACEQTNFKHEEFLDTLAAAHAEKGDFKTAVQWATKTLELDPQNRDFAEHLKLYKSGKPLRDESK
jgi:Tfp pilus assembly protein PilF